MKRFFQTTFACVVLASSAFGAKPLATVTSADPFAINGHAMNAPGVTSFPVILGDTVSTAKGSAVLSLPKAAPLNWRLIPRFESMVSKTSLKLFSWRVILISSWQPVQSYR